MHSLDEYRDIQGLALQQLELHIAMVHVLIVRAAKDLH